MDLAFALYVDGYTQGTRHTHAALQQERTVVLVATVTASNGILTDKIALSGSSHNLSTMAHLPGLSGLGPRTQYTKLFGSNAGLDGDTVHAARYLGPWLHYTGKVKGEVTRSIEAATWQMALTSGCGEAGLPVAGGEGCRVCQECVRVGQWSGACVGQRARCQAG